MKDKVLFKSKEYGYNGHNYCELRILEDGDIRLWVHDGGTNSLICLDREDLLKLGKQIVKHGSSAPEEHITIDIFKRNKKDVTVKRKRKTRSDKGKTKVKKPVVISSLDMDRVRSDKIAAAMEE